MTVWDCVLFNNELRLLEFRLDLLSRVVDRVLVVEAPATFRGKSKALHFADNASRFQRHLDRIVHVVAEGLDDPAASTWERQRRQHAAVRPALEAAGVAGDDLVIIADVDEIPSEEAVQCLAQEPPDQPIRITLRHALYFANWEVSAPWTDGPMAARGRDLRHRDLGVLLGDPNVAWGTTTEPTTDPWGWHLSYLGGPTRIIRKHEELSDTSRDNARDKDSSHVQRLLEYGVDLPGRHLLRRIPREELDPLQRRLQALDPGLFNFSPAPKGADAYRVFTRLRPRLPIGAARVADRVVVPLLPVLGPALLGVERLRQRRKAAGTANGLHSAPTPSP